MAVCAQTLVALLIFLGTGCGDNNRPASDAAPDDADLSEFDAGTTCQVVVGEPELAYELVAQGFNKPVAVVAYPEREMILVLEQHTGKVRIVEGGEVLGTDFLDIGDELAKAFEQGLLSLAFHPKFSENQKFFLTHTRKPDDALVLEEWTVSIDPRSADRSSRREVLVIDEPRDFHNGGHIAFGPDGYLYMGLGDGGPQNDPDGNTQDLSKLLGKFIRIDVNTQEGALPYGIPEDNPFLNVPGARPEIWIVGVRNPWAWSIDPATGHLYFGDVGFATWEEVNVVPSGTGPGKNYGWPIVLGFECREAGCDTSPFVPPLVAYSYISQQRCAVVGGYVYRGCRMPGHHGRYFYSDFCEANLNSLRYSALDGTVSSEFQHETLNDDLVQVSSFGIDHEGEILVLDWDDGQLFRIVPAQ